MKRIALFIFSAAAAFCCVCASAQELRSEVFDFLDLDFPGLEKVKSLHNSGDDKAAAEALLDYYRTRTVNTPTIDPSKVKTSPDEQKMADEALEHKFFSHKGYQPSFCYDDANGNIDWTYWPVKDNELRWQLHRHKWFVPMGKAYRVSGDEKYAEEWAFQYMDWIRKNPLVKLDKEEYELRGDASGFDADKENMRFAWRPLEVSHRLQDQANQFVLFLPSPSFTPEFLTEFLVNYRKHAGHIMNNWSKQGNHLLFEAQRMLCAGACFPEFKDARIWRQSGIDKLNEQVRIQVYDDGGHFELDPHYHLASIEIFCKSLDIARVSGLAKEFPQEYKDALESMIEFYLNIIFPDYTNPCFSDAKITPKSGVMKHIKDWTKLFPENQMIKYFATEGKEGALPEYLSKAFPTTGFFVFRNGWDKNAVQMVVKAGPPGEWHCQPDNGTFELWYNGNNLFPDSGSYVYAGEGEVMEWRNWFRQTASHNTITFKNANLETTDSKTLLWQPEGETQVLVTENQSYKNLSHRRSIFFVNDAVNPFFVIVDEAVGKAKGWVNLHYQMPPGQVENSREDMHFATEFEGESNMKLQCFGPEGMTMRKEKGWMSTDYMKKRQRMNVSFNVNKQDDTPLRYITVIVPKKTSGDDVKISAKFKDKGYSESGMSLEVKIGKTKKKLSYTL